MRQQQCPSYEKDIAMAVIAAALTVVFALACALAIHSCSRMHDPARSQGARPPAVESR
jgi:hypothetical protein